MTAIAASDRVPGTRRLRLSPPWIIAVGVVVSVFAIFLGTIVGTANVGIADVWETVWSRVLSLPVDADRARLHTIVGDLRLPRTLLAFVGGAALAIAGVVMQGLLRNPLVSPYTLGLSPAAAFGAALAILVSRLTFGQSSTVLTILSALLFGLLVSTIVLGLASIRRMSATTLILLGIALNQLFEALTSALQYVVDQDTLSEIVRWTFGSVNNARWPHVGIVTAVLVVSVPYLLFRAKALNAIAFAGDDAATSLGINVPRTRAALIAVAVLLTAVLVSFTGVIGFVGLVGPHIARIIIGSDHRYLLPFSLVAGGVLLITADVVGRIILAPAVVPVGIVVALVGAPVFINLIFSKRAARI